VKIKGGLGVLVLAIGLCVSQANAQVQSHGIIVDKGCDVNLCIGDAMLCEFAVSYNDDFGDTTELIEAWDMVDTDGDTVGDVRVPEVGNLEIVSAQGNTTCLVGGSLPCNIGPANSTLSGLPGDPLPGVVVFVQNTYVIEADDVSPLRDQATLIYRDLCDDPDTSGCNEVVDTATASAATTFPNCDDGDACTIDACELGICSNEPIICDDGDLCTTDECVDGECVFTPVDCDDGDACTEDSCDPDTGECVNTPIICDDGDACTEDECVDGICVFTTITCDDSDLCTTDECVDGECVFTPIVCDDGDACTTDECVDGECVFTPIDCDDGDACTIDECIDGECVHTPIVCDDGDACTTDECVDGECVFTPIDCDDGDECTLDECVDGECVFTPIDPPPPGCADFAGCTPGFWKQRHHFEYWVGYSPEDLYEDVFGVEAIALDGKTLLEAAGMGGGGEIALGRHAVAALLNSTNPEVEYFYTTDMVIMAVQEAYASGMFNMVKDDLEMQNELGCTVDKSKDGEGSGARGLRGGR